MGNPRGVRRDFEAMERRGWQAARLLRQGLSHSAVARQVGVHRQSVSRWAKQLAEGGKASLKKAGRAGRKPRLGPAELRRVGGGRGRQRWKAKRWPVLKKPRRAKGEPSSS